MSDLIDEEHRNSLFPDPTGLPRVVEVSSTHQGKLINARGTEDGLVVRIDGRAEWNEILGELRNFLNQRKSFVKGGSVSIEWLDRLPTKDQSKELEILLKETYGVEVIGKRKKDIALRTIDFARHDPKGESSSETFSLTEGERGIEKCDYPRIAEKEQLRTERGDKKGGEVLTIEHSRSGGIVNSAKSYIDRMAQMLGEDVFYDDDANAKIFFGTLRSGQRIETPFSLIIVGDVNPGADLVAGGDIIVFGNLRGTAHASAYDDDCSDRVIVALKMQPMQLRIGSVISRGNGESYSGAEIARIEDRRIVVETYNARTIFCRRIR